MNGPRAKKTAGAHCRSKASGDKHEGCAEHWLRGKQGARKEAGALTTAGNECAKKMTSGLTGKKMGAVSGGARAERAS